MSWLKDDPRPLLYAVDGDGQKLMHHKKPRYFRLTGNQSSTGGGTPENCPVEVEYVDGSNGWIHPSSIRVLVEATRVGSPAPTVRTTV
jgi:hypothetical protein